MKFSPSKFIEQVFPNRQYPLDVQRRRATITLQIEQSSRCAGRPLNIVAGHPVLETERDDRLFVVNLHPALEQKKPLGQTSGGDGVTSEVSHAE
jgi:hypothetical protein